MPAPKYSKRHYEDTAKILREARQVGCETDIETIYYQFVDLYTLDNPRFDAKRFHKAVFGE
jgi:hypothetical protein